MSRSAISSVKLSLFLLWALVLGAAYAHDKEPTYSIQGIHYGTIHGMERSFFVEGGTKRKKFDVPLIFWVLRDGERTVLFDAGHFRERWNKKWGVVDFVKPDEAIEAIGISAEDVTDVIVSHAHWDHMEGALLFPKATIWIQKEELEYYATTAWQEGGRNDGIDERDIQALVALNTEGKVQLVDGDDRELLPGIRAYTGGKHTFQSQYISVAAGETYVLASDNAYLYENIEEVVPIASGASFDIVSNKAALARMRELAGDPKRVIPGHDPQIFERFRADGRVVTINGRINDQQ